MTTDQDIYADHRNLRFLEGFEGVNNQTTLQRRYGLTTPIASNAEFVTGRRGVGTALRWPGTQAIDLDVAFNANDEFATDPVLSGLAVRWDEMQAAGELMLIAFRSGTLVQMSVHVIGDTDGDAYLEVRLGGTTSLGRTPVLKKGTWYYIEFRVVVDQIEGEYELRVDQVPFVKGTGDTQNDTQPIIDNVRVSLQSGQPGDAWELDDWYIESWRLGWRDLRFLGDLSIDGYLPAGIGDVSSLTPTGAPTNEEAVDDPTPDDDATYVATDGPGQDNYVHAALDRDAVTGRLLGIGITTEYRKAAPGGPTTNLVASIHDPDWGVGFATLAEPIAVPVVPVDEAWHEFSAAFEDHPYRHPLEMQEADRLQQGVITSG